MEELVKEFKELSNVVSELEMEIKEVSNKKKGFDNRIEEIRKIILDDMLSNGTMQEEQLGLLLVVKSVPAVPVIVDESLLPEKYIKTVRSVDKKLVNEDYKNGEEIPGVTMGNGGQTLMIKARS
jgi:hypothetical protein